MEKTPVFVKIEDYKDVLDIMNLIRNKIEDAKKTIQEINMLKNQEDSELELWHNELEDIERKVDFMDRTMFEPEGM